MKAAQHAPCRKHDETICRGEARDRTNDESEVATHNALVAAWYHTHTFVDKALGRFSPPNPYNVLRVFTMLAQVSDRANAATYHDIFDL